jgi:hypothetical protein
LTRNNRRPAALIKAPDPAGGRYFSDHSVFEIMAVFRPQLMSGFDFFNLRRKSSYMMEGGSLYSSTGHYFNALYFNAL